MATCANGCGRALWTYEPTVPMCIWCADQRAPLEIEAVAEYRERPICRRCRKPADSTVELGAGRYCPSCAAAVTCRPLAL